MLDKITTSEEFIQAMTGGSTLKRLVEHWAIRYLAAGDIAYTNMGLSLADMFRRFDNDPKRLAVDFEFWVEARLNDATSLHDAIMQTSAIIRRRA